MPEVKVTFPDKSTSTIYMYDLYCFCKDHGVYGGNATKVLRGEIKQTGKYIFKEIVKWIKLRYQKNFSGMKEIIINMSYKLVFKSVLIL